MALVAVTDHPFPHLEAARAVLEPAGHELVEHQCSTAAEVAEACAAADGVLNTYAPMPAAVIDALHRCQGIARFGIGVDTIDLDRATARRIVVTNVPDYCIPEVAAHTVALLLATQRRVVQLDRRVRRGEWGPFAAGEIRRITELRLGLVGAGRIPRTVATMAAALGMQVLAFDPYVSDADWPDGIERRSTLQELAGECDVLSVHAPLTPETQHLIDAAVLEAMPEHAILLNTARGGLVDTDALVAALQAGSIAAAGLDVVETEPPPADSPLRTLDQVVLTPHAAFYSESSLVELQRKAAEQLRAVLAGEPPTYLVNAAALDG
jgi:D-3-phosphoglycerate dehydrogenase / 2-oxoglutarate reductase